MFLKLKEKSCVFSLMFNSMKKRDGHFFQTHENVSVPYRIEAFAVSDIGCVRSNNEDNYILGNNINEQSLEHSRSPVFVTKTIDKAFFAGVFDGMGGGDFGEVAAKVTAECFLVQANEISGCKSKADADKVIRKAFQDSNNQIIDLQKIYRLFGTTGTALLVLNGELKIFHLGDSRAYLIRGRDMFQLTKDHTLAQFKKKIGLDTLSSEIDRHKLTEYIGKDRTKQNIKPEESEWISIEHCDNILLCSDGLYDMCSDNEISCVIQRNKSVQETVLDLISCAKENGGADNITCVLIKFSK